MIDLKAIRAAAEAATPGPWMAAGPSFGEPLPKYINCVVVENEDGDADDVCIAPIGCDAISTNDLTYIATANPATVIALCDEIERLRKEGECLLSLDSAEKLLEEIERMRVALKLIEWSNDSALQTQVAKEALMGASK